MCTNLPDENTTKLCILEAYVSLLYTEELMDHQNMCDVAPV